MNNYFFRVPLRVSLTGGGTDFPEFYKRNDGYTLSFNINSYIYLVFRENKNSTIQISYKKKEIVKSLKFISHPVVKIIFNRYNINNYNLDIISDVEGGTGLGSSSSFTVGLLYAVKSIKKIKFTKMNLAMEAYEIENKFLNQRSGYQDQLISAFGDVQFFKYTKENITNINIKNSLIIKKFLNNLYFVKYGEKRKSYLIQKKFITSLEAHKKSLLEYNLISKKILKCISKNDFISFKKNIFNAFEIKCSLRPIEEKNNIIKKFKLKSNNKFKILGAGKSGFVMIYSDTKIPNSYQFKIESDGIKSFII